MPNDRLRDALMAARITPDELADDLGVNPKTVERWITQGRAPYPRLRHRIAAQVQKSESYLWPDALSGRRRAEIAESEIVNIYPYRADVPAELWIKLFEDATENIDILVYSGFFLPEQYAPQLSSLCAKADGGARIRILIGDPDCPQVAQRGEEEEIGDAIASKIRNVLIAYYHPYSDYPGINIKLHSTTLYNSIYWFDDDMLVNTHAYGVPANFAPTLHLRNLSSGTLFQTYARSFERVWDRTHATWPKEKAA